jgi:hypothetical protein
VRPANEATASWYLFAEAFDLFCLVTLFHSIFALVAVFLVNAYFRWDEFDIGRRKSGAIIMLIFLFWWLFVAPTRKDFRERRKSLEARHSRE